MCLASNDPVEVLLRKQPPSVTASFYQRVKFLIEENSVQSYAHMDEYSERWVISDFHVPQKKFKNNQVVAFDFPFEVLICIDFYVHFHPNEY